jgi:hypothetical protein
MKWTIPFTYKIKKEKKNKTKTQEMEAALNIVSKVKNSILDYGKIT